MNKNKNKNKNMAIGVFSILLFLLIFSNIHDIKMGVEKFKDRYNIKKSEVILNNKNDIKKR